MPVGMLKGKRPLGSPRCRWVDNIKMDLQEIGWDDMLLIGQAQDKDKWRTFVNGALNLEGSINSWEVLKWLHSPWPLE
jgi:hypothetical protein